ncbi:MAG: ATP-binding protein [Spirosomataceae bacterium]
MTLKRRLAINVSLAFSLLFGLASTIIYQSFSDFRKDEFKQRLNDKALTTAKLLVEVKEVDKQLLKLIDKNSINKLFNEKALVFDTNFNLIYSSIDDSKITWSLNDLKKLKQEKTFFRREKENEVMGIFYDFEHVEYLILISAEDKYGNSKLAYLLYILITTYIVSVTLIWIFTYFLISSLLKPLDEFQGQITNISINNLNIKLPERYQKDEINILTQAFNILLQRIDNAFRSQKEFTSNASHEIRTPLARIAFQVENLIHNYQHTIEVKNFLNNIKNDTYHLSDLINSLLLLSKLDKSDEEKFEKIQIDEVIFSAYDQTLKTFPNLMIDFELAENTENDISLTVQGIKSMLEIVFINIFKNAALYSANEKIYVTLLQISSNQIEISIMNKGDIITEAEQAKLFTPFMRGENSKTKNGSGLGLTISKRILEYHKATIKYASQGYEINVFKIIFKN